MQPCRFITITSILRGHELWTQRGECYVRSFKKDPWITCSLSCRNKGETVPRHTEILFNSRLSVLPQIMALRGFALSSAKSEFFFLTLGKKMQYLISHKTSRGLCLCSCGSKRDRRIINCQVVNAGCFLFFLQNICIAFLHAPFTP